MLKDIFGKATRGKRLKSADRIKGNLPFVTAGEKDEGVSAFIGNDVTVFSENTITIDMFGSAKYRNYKYGADDHIAVIHTQKTPKNAVIFITSAINRVSYTGEFHYGRNFYAKDADVLNIKLPITAEGEINFAFMEKFIAELEAERIAELEAYLIATGLSDYILSKAEKEVLRVFRESDKILRGGGNSLIISELQHFSEGGLIWEEFKLGDLFEVNTWEYGKNKKYSLIKKIFTKNSIPVISGVTENNGVNYYTEDVLSEHEVFESELTISTRGVYSGTVFYQDGKFALANNILVMKMPKLSKKQKQFIGSIINSLPYGGYDGYPKKETLKQDKIQLPTKDGKPDYQIMETFISAIQKLVIKDVVQYAERKIAATRQVVGG